MILLKNLFVGGLHLLMEIRKFAVTLKNWIIMNGLIKILYKTLTGEYATRWARENELSRLKGVKPLDTERFGLVYPEPPRTLHPAPSAARWFPASSENYR